jgi:hypothetical protein
LCYSVLILIKPLVSKFLSKFLKFYISWHNLIIYHLQFSFNMLLYYKMEG